MDPRTGSNVLYRVSASELKAEEMIKLPIVLTVHQSNWEEAVGDACLTRKRLAELAGGDPPRMMPKHFKRCGLPIVLPECDKLLEQEIQESGVVTMKAIEPAHRA